MDFGSGESFDDHQAFSAFRPLRALRLCGESSSLAVRAARRPALPLILLLAKVEAPVPVITGEDQ